jgi:hypothetical protein
MLADEELDQPDPAPLRAPVPDASRAAGYIAVGFAALILLLVLFAVWVLSTLGSLPVGD